MVGAHHTRGSRAVILILGFVVGLFTLAGILLVLVK
ncbi:hypothetical protein M446_0728 [Methylobacterium sp. 4-46]|nr:hypothetical protein M446_0728 [Methylobacterium sp. 4-46]